MKSMIGIVLMIDNKEEKGEGEALAMDKSAGH